MISHGDFGAHHALLLLAGHVALDWASCYQPLLDLNITPWNLAGVGLVLGTVVDEQRRTGEDLRQSLRLAAAGEMAGAIAHQRNQPPTATSAYSETCEPMLDLGRAGDAMRGPIRSIVKASQRAADIVRRLRDCFRFGTTKLEHAPIQALIENAATPFATAFDEQPYEPFRSTKASGLGRAISRAVEKARGGERRALGGGAGLFEVLLAMEKDIV